MKSKRPRSHDRILGLLNTQPQALSAQEIFIELRQRNQSLGLATIYRALEALKLAGLLQVRTQTNGEALYSSAHQDRHHLTCLQCGDSIPLDRCPIHDLEQQLQHVHQFKIYYHTLEFFGLCDQCAIAGSTVQPKNDPDSLQPS
ncbi:MAG: transcriptional repressor [Coleofasciculaceae cyanobacterium RL_1_1]|nr:transcriptional repressor [Coleofasciculaceae cyanobacterium RL_1_1]